MKLENSYNSSIQINIFQNSNFYKSNIRHLAGHDGHIQRSLRGLKGLGKCSSNQYEC